MLRFKTGFSPLISATELTKEAGNNERCEESQVWGYSQTIKWKFLCPFPLTLICLFLYTTLHCLDFFNFFIMLVKLYNATVTHDVRVYLRDGQFKESLLS